MSEYTDLLNQLPVPDHTPDFWAQLETQLTATSPDNTLPTEPSFETTDVDFDFGTPDPAPDQLAQRRRTRRWILTATTTAAAIVAIIIGLNALTEDTAPSPVVNEPPPSADDVGLGTRSVVSPLVEMSTLLAERSDVELFSVSVDEAEADYWRLMALTRFENEIWRRSSDFEAARDAVDGAVDPTVPSRTVTQEITISALGNIYLPAAFELSRVVDDGGVNLEYEVATGALVIEQGLDVIPSGLTYVIESQVPDHDPASFPADASEGLGDKFIAEYTQLPTQCESGEVTAETGCWPSGITAEAERIVDDAGATTDHERARALQNFFLDPTLFTYDLDVALEHNVDDVNTFLTIGRGYSEQFASAFAAMARSLEIPSRVAVGFTWGDWDEASGGYVVSGRHAHAWPEVYFSGVGWIVFDPTRVGAAATTPT